jgi:hypothetical protein
LTTLGNFVVKRFEFLNDISCNQVLDDSPDARTEIPNLLAHSLDCQVDSLKHPLGFLTQPVGFSLGSPRPHAVFSVHFK